MTTLLLTVGIVGSAVTLLGIGLIITGRQTVHSSCSATHALDPGGEDAHCEFCPNDEDPDQLTTLAKAGYPGRKNIISEEAYQGKDRNLVIEKLKYSSGRE